MWFFAFYLLLCKWEESLKIDSGLRRAWRYQREIIRIRKSKKDRQHNGQKKKYKKTNNDLQNITHKTKDRVTRSPLNDSINMIITNNYLSPYWTEKYHMSMKVHVLFSDRCTHCDRLKSVNLDIRMYLNSYWEENTLFCSMSRGTVSTVL
jgi:hypothetical protein